MTKTKYLLIRHLFLTMASDKSQSVGFPLFVLKDTKGNCLHCPTVNIYHFYLQIRKQRVTEDKQVARGHSQNLIGPIFKSVNLKGNQSQIFIGKTDAEAEAPILWPPDSKS